jgi:hypothetical protein
MARFLLQATHTPEQCLAALDELVALGPGEIDKWDLGCAVGDHSNHVAFRIAEASDAATARNLAPASMQGQAQVTEIGKVTAEQVRSYHNP